MRSPTAGLIVFCALFAATDMAHAQFRAEIWSAGESMHATPPVRASMLTVGGGGDAAAPLQAGPSYGRVLTGTVVGGALGAAAGLGIAVVVGQRGDAVMFPGDLAAGTMLGGVTGMYVGARVGSGGRGNQWATGAAVIGGAVAGVLVGASVGAALAQAGTHRAPEIIGGVLGAGIPLGLTSWVEWRTAS